MIAWLAIKERLNTRDRLAKFGLCADPRCVLCGINDESHNHLFFDCEFSSVVWKSVVELCGVHWNSRLWKDWISMLS